MKIDCPHCGVHGSVDDSLAGKKLRCPKCGKVFLVTADIHPGTEDMTMVRQEILDDESPQASEAVAAETAVAEEPAASLKGSVEELMEDNFDSDDASVAECSVCNQSFAAAFLVEIDSQLYCALCQPDSEDTEEDELDFLDEGDVEDVSEDELLDIMEEEFYAEDDDGEHSAKDESDEGLMEDEEEPEDGDGNLLLMAEEDESGSEEVAAELETCSGCGESLHPDFLETVGAERFCALCTPEEDDSDAEQDDGFGGDELEADEQAVADDDFGDSPKEVCSVCGEEFYRDFMQEVDSKLYCGVCQPEVIEVLSGDDRDLIATENEDFTEDLESDPDFTVGDLVKEAWQKTKGAKGAVWAAMIVLYAICFGISLGGMTAFYGFYKGSDPAMVMGINGTLQLITTWLSMLMTGGVMLIGVRRALGQRVSWKMVFAGFPKAFSITIAMILQTILVLIGFLLLVLPGIYLIVGYALTLPLIIDKGMGPWQALEASRKAIHKKWWTVFGLYLVMMLIYMVSAIPLGLGLIWTVPMFFVSIGVLYVHFFGHGEATEDDTVESGEENEAEDVQDDASEEGAEQV